MNAASQRDELIDAGVALIEAGGWQEFTLDKLSASLNVELATVLRAFPSREHLAAAFVERMLDQLPHAIAPELTPDAGLRERLYAPIAFELYTLSGKRELVRGMLFDSLSPLSPVIALQLPSVLRFVGFVTDQIRTAKLRGEISPWVIPNVAGASFWLVHLRILGYWLNDSSAQDENTHAFADGWIIRFVTWLGGVPPRWNEPP